MKNSKKLDQYFWAEHYQNEDIPWDLGGISPTLKAYIDQLKSKSIKILIPGSGNGYEGSYLFQKGFSNVTLIDLVEDPLANFSKKNPDFQKNQLIQGDFFQHKGAYDLILEQTFFCALDPVLRKSYVQKMNALLKEKGKLAGVLFNFALTDDGPPFGGSVQEYVQLFEKYFNILILEPAYNSIKPRSGNELFFIFEKK